MGIQKQAEAEKNKLMEILAKCLICCMWCLEKCIKFLNKNAYIQVALMGTNFCTSAKNAFWLILRNILRIGMLAALGALIQTIGKICIALLTALVGFFILDAMYPDLA